MKDILRSQFDEIIGRNFERLTGTKQGIGGLPLNIATIGCFTILGGREIEIENSSSDAAERYTRETFLHEAAGLGIEADAYLEGGLHDMIQRGYFEVDSRGRIIAQESTTAMTRVLDRIFPKMKGINLLAYIGQTVEEAVTGRTDMESATSRFDQTLKNQGVSISVHKSPQASLSTGIDTTPKETRMSREKILAELYSRAKTPKPNASSLSRSSRVLAGGAVLKSLKVDDILPKDGKAPESPRNAEPEKMADRVDAASRTQDIIVAPVDGRVIGAESETERTAEGPRISRAHEAVLETEQTASLIPHDSQPNDESAELLRGMDEDTPVNENVRDASSLDEDAIADKIAAFEKDLSFTCPICKKNILNEQSTAAGRKYYTCPSSTCNFISWGKPHHVECTRCKNPFLIEAADASGEIILKCPRATCQHRQGLNPKLVKVVRKRVVRKMR